MGLWIVNGICQAILAANGVKATWASYFILLAAIIVNIVFEILDDKRKENIYNILETIFKERGVKV